MTKPLSPVREAEIRSRRYQSRSLMSADIDIDDLLAEIDRLRGTVAHHAERAEKLGRHLRAVRSERNTAERARDRFRTAWRSARQRAAGHWEAAGWIRDERDAEPPFPSRFSATPAEVDQYLRRILAEDTYLRYQQAIGSAVSAEAAADLVHEVEINDSESTANETWLTAADVIDASGGGGGPYPSQLLCSRHDGFGPCPGAPRCTPRQDEGAESWEAERQADRRTWQHDLGKLRDAQEQIKVLIAERDAARVDGWREAAEWVHRSAVEMEEQFGRWSSTSIEIGVADRLQRKADSIKRGESL